MGCEMLVSTRSLHIMQLPGSVIGWAQALLSLWLSSQPEVREGDRCAT